MSNSIIQITFKTIIDSLLNVGRGREQAAFHFFYEKSLQITDYSDPQADTVPTGTRAVTADGRGWVALHLHTHPWSEDTPCDPTHISRLHPPAWRSQCVWWLTAFAKIRKPPLEDELLVYSPQQYSPTAHTITGVWLQ